MCRMCAGCGLNKFLRDGETYCPACIGRGHAPAHAGFGGLRGVDALRQLDGQADDPAERRAMAYVETRARLSAGDVTNSTEALNWLHDNMRAGSTVRHEGPR